ncbi:MAG TPA: hypothetical protein VMT37_07555 [Solirubrobacterales bacterium]|nr:hypothetical protein [Solirubrobacterales bacterium]
MKPLRPTSPTHTALTRVAALAAAALSLLAALALPAVASAAKPYAYFKVGLKASVKLNWTEDMTGSCNGLGVLRTVGSGSSTATMHSTREVTAVLERGIGQPVFRSGGEELALPIGGHGTRRGSIEGWDVVAPPPGACPKPEPIAPDCGSFAYPPDSEVTVAYRTPDSWPYETPAPLTDVLVLDGPFSTEWPSGPPFENCPSIGRGELISSQLGTELTPPLTLAVSLRNLLKRKRFTLKRHTSTHVDAFPKGLPGVSGTMPVRIETKVTLDFTRLAHKPRGA